MSCNKAISQIEKDVLIKLHVIPNSLKSIFPAGYNKWRNCIEIKVKAEAKENKANSEVIEKISKCFNILPKDVLIVSGHKIRDKNVLLKNTNKSDILKKIEDNINGL